MEQVQLIFDVDIPAALPLVCVWPDQVEAIVLNLLDNAIKYTRPGGTVHFIAASDDRRCRIAIEDTGPSIPAEDLPHIFEQFYRVDKARNRQENGTGSGAGLGLSLIETLVKRNSGTITVESIEGEGSTLTVEFANAQYNHRRSKTI